MHALMYPWTRPRNWDFEWQGWNVDVCLDWNASSGWRDRRGDVDWDGDVDIFDATKVNSKNGKDVGDSRWHLVCDLNGDDTYIKVAIWCKIQVDPEGWQYMSVTFKTETFTEDTILNATR